ncbi:MAG: efflux RND transporter periplasmic adaptor subunit [Limisphaerales bacterium]
MKMKEALFAVGLSAGAVMMTGCQRGGGQQTPPPPPVTVAPVEQKEIVEWSEFTGHTEPIQSVDIRPRVSGYIQKVDFQSGQLVKKGDVLFEIDPRWNQAVFDQRQAEYDEAKSEADRIQLLLENRAISQEEADTRRAKYEEAKATLDSARLDLDYTKVRAPIDGRVSRALLTEGNYVNGVAGGASLLTTIVSVGPIYAEADVDENSLLKLNSLIAAKEIETNGDGRIPVELELADETNFPHQGEVESLDNQLNADTGSILLRAVFPNADGQLVPGMFARVRVPLSERHLAVLVNDRAIETDQSQKFVFTLTSSNTVAYQAIQLGPTADGEQIVESGLRPGQKIIVNGLANIRAGMTVSPEGQTASRAEIKTALR